MKTPACLPATFRSSLVLLAAWALALASCAGAPAVSFSTPLPEDDQPAVFTPAPLTETSGKQSKGTSAPKPVSEAPAALPVTAPPSGTGSSPPVPAGLAGSSATPPPTTPPTSTPTPPAQAGDIWIYSPGPLSKVTSPLHLQASARPGPGGQVRVELLGEDGRLLTRKIQAVHNLDGEGFAGLAIELDFEVTTAGEAGRLKISVDDALGRMTALNSVPLILLSAGEPHVLAPPGQPSPILLQQPSPNTLIQGGKLVVAGLARPSSSQPLMVRLLSPEGKQLGQRLAGVSTAAQGEYGRFSVEVPFTVSAPTEALLVVWEGGSALQDIIYLTSLVVRLNP